MTSLSRYILLRTGARMPSVGLGTYLSGSQPGECEESVQHALSVGYRHLDTALSYGTEAEVGEAVDLAVRTGKIRRKDLFITTKVPPIYLSPESVKFSLDQSLDKLRTNYVDMLLIHQPWGRRNRGDGVLKPVDEHGNPEYEHHDLLEAWRVFEDAVSSGKAKGIGVSNFTVPQLERIRENARIQPANLQLELHAYNQQSKLLSYCRQHEIAVSAYCPLGAPYKVQQGTGRDDASQPGALLNHPTVSRIAETHGVRTSQILLNFLLRLGVAVLPKSTNPQRIEQNMDIFGISLSSSEMEQLRKLHNGVRYFSFEWSKGHPEFLQGEPY